LRTVTPGACSTCPETYTEAVEHRYTWDAAGFATSRDGVPIAWDATGHLASFGPATFAHDAEGRLRGSLVAGVVKQRRFGGLVEADAAGRPVRIDLGAVEIDLAANRRRYRHLDWRGNVRSVWSDTGEIQAVREYGAYGVDRTHGETDDPRGFAQGLETAGLVVLGDRVYDPAARRFLSPDPVYSAFHQHVYGAGDPANYWDWTGRTAEQTVGFKLAGAFGEGAGFAGGLLLGFAAGARTGNAGVGMGLATLFAMKGAEASRGAAEAIFRGLYDWFQSKPPRKGALGGDAPLGALGLPPPAAGPSQPRTICGGECYLDFDGNKTGGPPGSRGGGPSGGSTFFLPNVTTGCGLLGVEPLALLVLLARRRRSPRLT